MQMSELGRTGGICTRELHCASCCNLFRPRDARKDAKLASSDGTSDCLCDCTVMHLREMTLHRENLALGVSNSFVQRGILMQ